MRFTQYGNQKERRKKKEFHPLYHFIRVSFLSSTKLCCFSSSIHCTSAPISKIYCFRKSWVECSSRTGPLLQQDLKWCQEMGGGREGEHSKWHSPRSGNSLGRICGKPEVYRSKAPQSSARASPIANLFPLSELKEKRTLASSGELGMVPADDTLWQAAAPVWVRPAIMWCALDS